MKKLVTLSALLLAGAGVLATAQQTAQPAAPAQQPAAAPANPAKPESLQDRASYIIGLNLGRNLKSEEVPANPDLVIKGSATASRAPSAHVTDEEMQATMQAFQQQVMAAAGGEAEVEGEKNKTAGEAFLAKNKAKRASRPPRAACSTRSQGGHRPDPEGDRHGDGELQGHADGRHEVRQLLRPRPAGHVRAQPGDPGLDRGRAAHEGRLEVQVLHPRRRSATASEGAGGDDRPQRAAGLRGRALSIGEPAEQPACRRRRRRSRRPTQKPAGSRPCRLIAARFGMRPRVAPVRAGPLSVSAHPSTSRCAASMSSSAISIRSRWVRKERTQIRRAKRRRRHRAGQEHPLAGVDPVEEAAGSGG